jgi:hypothetical protein
MIISKCKENQDYKAAATIARRQSDFVSILAAGRPGALFSYYEIKYRNLKKTKTAVRIVTLKIRI